MHEIITLQLGHQSNYVATHFWNAQESYFTYGQDAPSPVDHDIHWRAGIGADGSETYLPRTVIYDRKGGFGSLRKVNALYDEAQKQGASAMDLPSSSLWSGRTVVQRETPILPSAYTQSLDTGVTPTEPLTPATVRYWSDYSRVYFHPRSLIEVGDEPEVSGPSTSTVANGASDGNGSAAAAAAPREYTWNDGETLFTELDREHDLLDRDMRLFVEEADQMQGFQVMASVDDSWGGFAARYLERMRDEYGKVNIWLWALQQPVGRLPREKRISRLANKARTLVEAYTQASLIIPLAVPPLPLKSVLPSTFDPASTWHTSALLATAIETATFPTRLRQLGSGSTGQGGDSLANLVDLLNATGKQTVANLQMSVVQPWKEVKKDARERREAAGFDEDDDYGGSSGNAGSKMDGDLQLSIDFAPRDESVVVAGRAGRGLRGKKPRMFGQAVVTRATPEEGDDKIHNDDDDEDDNDRESSAALNRREMMHRRYALKPVSQRYTVSLGFPLLDSFPYIYQQTTSGTASVPVTTALATDRAVADRLQALRTTVTVGAPWAIGLEDREALGNDLAGMADAYHDGWSSGSDDGDDDD
ncbi:mtDNA inheritance, partitioning of the mitochondrial organelle [Sporothrix bragantina]|uniref:MtDNA inheritance, partitioning of the mitochondrial organelle n=1 Tax=Sporothrix bragantina TaxID=671064 RepID=A0ABP0C8A7_9PEZI